LSRGGKGLLFSFHPSQEQYVIEIDRLTDFNRTDAQLEELFVFAVVSGGRPTRTVSRQLEELLALLAREHDKGLAPFALLNMNTESFIGGAIKQVGVGCYGQKAQAVAQAAGRWAAGLLDLRACSVEQLETIKWVGARTCRFFILHTRPGARVAIIDDHVLKHLRERGVPDVTVAPPGKGKHYARLEEAFLKLADEEGVSPVEYEMLVRRRYAEKDSS
jgi:hypothetical protein